MNAFSHYHHHSLELFRIGIYPESCPHGPTYCIRAPFLRDIHISVLQDNRPNTRFTFLMTLHTLLESKYPWPSLIRPQATTSDITRVLDRWPFLQRFVVFFWSGAGSHVRICLSGIPSIVLLGGSHNCRSFKSIHIGRSWRGKRRRPIHNNCTS